MKNTVKYVIAEYDPERDLEIHGEYMPPVWVYTNISGCPKFCSELALATKFNNVAHAASVCNQVYTIYDFSEGLRILNTESAETLEAVWHVMGS